MAYCTFSSRVAVVLLSLQLAYIHDDVEEKIAQICKEAPDLSEL